MKNANESDAAHTVILTGPLASETAPVLVRRLLELGGRVDRIMPQDEAVCIAFRTDVPGDRTKIAAETDANDTPDFAAEKVLDMLAATGLIAIDLHDYSPEEEERIRERLANLGYIE
ncbi:MAG TPA: hypothetical protein PLO62_05255 [Candidatus Hydrogenedentes bacterium]|nr:hypothetical protein [Candidatus Hydrogenedentota bacterium]HOS02806.1 hypothetical protein [Candidatus Hydrogenedentota bacterium]